MTDFGLKRERKGRKGRKRRSASSEADEKTEGKSSIYQSPPTKTRRSQRKSKYPKFTTRKAIISQTLVALDRQVTPAK
jgi:hypothetical protein